MLENIKGEEERGTEGGCQAVIGWGLEGQEVDLLGGLGADNAAFGLDGNGE